MLCCSCKWDSCEKWFNNGSILVWRKDYKHKNKSCCIWYLDIEHKYNKYYEAIAAFTASFYSYILLFEKLFHCKCMQKTVVKASKSFQGEMNFKT